MSDLGWVPVDGKWHHVVATSSQTYVDGRPVDEVVRRADSDWLAVAVARTLSGRAVVFDWGLSPEELQRYHDAVQKAEATDPNAWPNYGSRPR